MYLIISIFPGLGISPWKEEKTKMDEAFGFTTFYSSKGKDYIK